MPVIDAARVSPDVSYALQGDGKTYLLDREEFEAAMRAAEAVSNGRTMITTGEAAKLLQEIGRAHV